MAPRQRSGPPLGPGPAPPQEADLLTVAEVAQLCRVSKMTVYRLVRSGELPAGRIGRQLRIRRDDVGRILGPPAPPAP